MVRRCAVKHSQTGHVNNKRLGTLDLAGAFVCIIGETTPSNRGSESI